MRWNIGNFDIISYDAKNKEHNQFRKELVNDPMISLYFKNAVMYALESTYPEHGFAFNQAYFVANPSALIGYLYIGNCDFTGVLSLNYALHSSFRGQHIGSEMLKQIRDFLIQNIAQINNIDLAIPVHNMIGVKTAISAGFEFYKEQDNIKHYRYYI